LSTAPTADRIPVKPSDERPTDVGRLIILTAGIGAGHDGAARAWGVRLAEAGYSVEIIDLLTVLRHRRPPRVSHAYESVLNHMPWVYEWFFRLGSSRAGVLLWRGMLGLFLKRTSALIADEPAARRRRHRVAQPLVGGTSAAGVLCTYPMAGHLLGEMRRCGLLRVPAVVYLTDMSVHRLCVSPGVDAHFAVHPVSAEQAARHGAAAVTITGALVDQAFGTEECERTARRAARIAFGLPETGRLALLVAGSWGVGDVERAANDIAATGVATPVIICGRNERLRSRLAARSPGIALGWVDNMPLLMRAVDVLVENAGGLTSLEAMAVGLPVASYRPLAGHGRTNAEALEEAGVSSYIRDTRELAKTLSGLIDGGQGQLQQQRAKNLFRADDPVAAFEAVLQAARATPEAESSPLSVQQGAARPARLPNAVRVGSWGRHVAAAMTLILLALLGDTVGAGFAVAHGLEAVHPAGRQNSSYLVIRPGQGMQFTPATIDLLRRTSAGVAVDRRYADQQPAAVQELARAGVPIVNAAADPPDGAWMLHRPAAIRDGMHDITRLTGARPRLYLSSRHMHSLDLATVSVLHERVVQPRVRLDGTMPSNIQGGELILIDCSRAPNCGLPARLVAVRDAARRSGVDLEPITNLDR
jgi:processive 1,2-diacylglycerol beta-glucosyltransferase